MEQLFKTVRSIAANGTSVVFVSHRLDEVMSLTDRTTVLRDGKVVGTLTTLGSDEEELIELILGGHNSAADFRHQRPSQNFRART